MRHTRRTILIGAGCVGALALAGCATSTVSKAHTAAPVSTSSSAPQSAIDVNGEACASLDSAGYCPGDSPSPSALPTVPAAPPVTVSPAAPSITSGQQQALDSAQAYLSDGQGFSREGLITQLTSSYGEGFGSADATWAVDHSGADWDAQAVISAKNYMADGQGFSRAGLIQQLTSSYGEGFTYAQAEYAVSKIGL